MPENTKAFETDRKNTDLAEGELETVEDSIRIHEGKPPAHGPKKPEPDRKNLDLAEGERDTVEESIRIHEEKGDEQGGGARDK
jgi:hypothetical protein